MKQRFSSFLTSPCCPLIYCVRPEVAQALFNPDGVITTLSLCLPLPIHTAPINILIPHYPVSKWDSSKQGEGEKEGRKRKKWGNPNMKNNRMEESMSYGQLRAGGSLHPERGEGRVPGWGKASPPSTTFTDALFTAMEEQLYGSVIQPFVTANGTQRKTKTSKEQAKVSEREKQEKIVLKPFVKYL